MTGSFPTIILGIQVYYCMCSQEHYCVDERGFIALWNYIHADLIKDYVPVTSLDECVGMIAYKKLPIKYNPKLDNGDPDDPERKNSEGCIAEETI